MEDGENIGRGETKKRERGRREKIEYSVHWV
jgi:hypothetical protein